MTRLFRTNGSHRQGRCPGSGHMGLWGFVGSAKGEAFGWGLSGEGSLGPCGGCRGAGRPRPVGRPCRCASADRRRRRPRSAMRRCSVRSRKKEPSASTTDPEARCPARLQRSDRRGAERGRHHFDRCSRRATMRAWPRRRLLATNRADPTPRPCRGKSAARCCREKTKQDPAR